MQKYYITVLCAISLTFSSELRTACDVHAGWRYMDHGGHFGQAGLRLIAPFSDYIGLTAGLIDLIFVAGAIRVSTGSFGFIEKMKTKHISPYATQLVFLDLGAYLYPGEHSYIDFGVGLGLGAEFMSNKKVCPFIEGTYTFYTGNTDGYIIGASIGVRANF